MDTKFKARRFGLRLNFPFKRYWQKESVLHKDRLYIFGNEITMVYGMS